MNVAKHADASRITVAIDVGAELTLTVLDDGRGLVPAAGSGFGLANMRDRARTLGGTFTIEDRDGGGTAVVWSVPLIHGG
jgi:signal transduction histidine kinase